MQTISFGDGLCSDFNPSTTRPLIKNSGRTLEKYIVLSLYIFIREIRDRGTISISAANTGSIDSGIIVLFLLVQHHYFGTEYACEK
jgi:hypothetical protein